MGIIFIYTISGLVSFLISFITIPLMRKIALKYNILDFPLSSVKTHKHPTPYLGGLSIWLGFVISLIFVRFVTHFPTGTLRSLRGILLGGLAILILGLIDDIKHMGLNFKKKFLFQFFGSVALIFFNIKINFIRPEWFAILITIIWIVGITNAFNIIDIMDGLASGIAIFVCFGFLIVSLPAEDIYVNIASIALAGACLGFLPFNLSNRYKIFMGDTGSLFIGFVISAISLGTSYTHFTPAGVFSPILLLAIPIFETFSVIYFRWKKGILPFLGSLDHFALRLQKMGFEKIRILLFTYLTNTILIVLAYFLTRLSGLYPYIICSVVGLMFLLFAFWISKAEV